MLSSDGIDKIVIHSDTDIHIEKSESSVTVNLSLNKTINSNNVNYSYNIKDRVLNIQVHIRGTFSGSLLIEVPSDKILDIESLSGTIFTNKTLGKKFYAKTASGDINITESSFTYYKLESLSGTIVVNVKEDECNIESKTLSGDVVIKGIRNSSHALSTLICSTMSGDIAIKKLQ